MRLAQTSFFSAYYKGLALRARTGPGARTEEGGPARDSYYLTVLMDHYRYSFSNTVMTRTVLASEATLIALLYSPIEEVSCFNPSSHI